MLPRNGKNKIRYNKPTTAPFESERKSKPSKKNAAAATLSAEGMTYEKRRGRQHCFHNGKKPSATLHGLPLLCLALLEVRNVIRFNEVTPAFGKAKMLSKWKSNFSPTLFVICRERVYKSTR